MCYCQTPTPFPHDLIPPCVPCACAHPRFIPAHPPTPSFPGSHPPLGTCSRPPPRPVSMMATCGAQVPAQLEVAVGGSCHLTGWMPFVTRKEGSSPTSLWAFTWAGPPACCCYSMTCTHPCLPPAYRAKAHDPHPGGSPLATFIHEPFTPRLHTAHLCAQLRVRRACWEP